jgi:hypothetical protein
VCRGGGLCGGHSRSATGRTALHCGTARGHCNRPLLQPPATKRDLKSTFSPVTMMRYAPATCALQRGGSGCSARWSCDSLSLVALPATVVALGLAGGRCACRRGCRRDSLSRCGHRCGPSRRVHALARLVLEPAASSERALLDRVLERAHCLPAVSPVLARLPHDANDGRHQRGGVAPWAHEQAGGVESCGQDHVVVLDHLRRDGGSGDNHSGAGEQEPLPPRQLLQPFLVPAVLALLGEPAGSTSCRSTDVRAVGAGSRTVRQGAQQDERRVAGRQSADGAPDLGAHRGGPEHVLGVPEDEVELASRDVCRGGPQRGTGIALGDGGEGGSAHVS